MQRVADSNRAAGARGAMHSLFYFDDFLLTLDGERPISIAHDIECILSVRHFRLRKWKSNKLVVVEAVTHVPASLTGLTIDQPLT